MITHPINTDGIFTLKEYGLILSDINDCTICQFEAGEIIFKQGILVDQLFIVLQGKVKVYTLAENGKDFTLCYYVSSGILGDIELMQEDKSAPATSAAALPCICVRIPLLHNLIYLRSNIAFMNLVAKGLSTKLLSSSNAYIASALYTGEERLCSYILMAEHNGLFTDILSDVSKSIGISYRHLFRMLHELCRCGVLEKRESGFQILDKQYLLQKCTHP